VCTYAMNRRPRPIYANMDQFLAGGAALLNLSPVVRA
jgi:hypothetical protein